ncbi:hypothetical protein JOD64_000695 [Micromonospora luteifusca]|uniref:DUF2180 family protein n=1 Tax=Micromonospora luteifusca TaxID=709860 RepID=A0ABS2LNM4_9ACTN|nr:hypothetical protein [Micromonospora luteifusca]
MMEPPTSQSTLICTACRTTKALRRLPMFNCLGPCTSEMVLVCPNCEERLARESLAEGLE